MLVHVDIFRRILNIKKNSSLNDSKLVEEMKVKLKKRKWKAIFTYERETA